MGKRYTVLSLGGYIESLDLIKMEMLYGYIYHMVFTEIVMTFFGIFGLQAVAGFLLDEYLSKSGKLCHNYDKIGERDLSSYILSSLNKCL